MNMSIGIALAIVIAIILGVFVFADSIAPVEKDEKQGGQPDPSGPVNTSATQVELLVRFAPELWNQTSLQSAAAASHASVGAAVLTDYDELGLPGLQHVLLPPGMSAEDGIAFYESIPYVQYAEKNYEYSIENAPEHAVRNISTDGNMTNVTDGKPGRLLVQFNMSAFSDTSNMSRFAEETHRSINATLVNDFTKEGLAGLQLVELAMNMTIKVGMGVYNNLTEVLFAEPDYPVTIEPVKK